MPSPFPGMDPYLEGKLWPDVHHRLATEISRKLTPRLRPRYVARIEVAILQDVSYVSEITITYPDVAVLRSKHVGVLHDSREATSAYGTQPTATPWGTIPPAPLVMEAPEAFRFKQATVEVRRADDNQLITAIEIISPANKRESGLTDYQQKRKRLYQAGVHLLEYDLSIDYSAPPPPPPLAEEDATWMKTLLEKTLTP